MSLIPKSEKGKSKTAKKPTSRSKAWLTNERQDAQKFQDIDGRNEQYGPLTTSTGRVGQLTHLQFDAISAHYCIETKRRVLPAWLITAWSQIIQVSMKHRLNAVLVLHFPEDADRKFIFEGKTHRTPELHCITPERHAFLLECERRCELLDSADSAQEVK